MKIKGIVLVSPLISQMSVGESGFLSADAIIVINNSEIFIDTRKSISQIKNVNTGYTIPITRTGEGKEDFELDFNITQRFFNNETNEEIKEEHTKNFKLIGPFTINVELYQALNYRKQLYPRMDLTELMSELVTINECLREASDNEVFVEDKKQARIFIKEKLKKLCLKELEDYQKTFEPLSEEESNGGETINYVEDKGIANFVFQQIQKLKENQGLEEMSVKDLEKELETANKNENFERSSLILNLITSKKEISIETIQ